MKTHAAVLWGPHQDWQVEEIELDPPTKGEVLVKWEAAGLCHSDEHLVTGDMVMPAEVREQMGLPDMFPIVGGHEGAGVVLELGEGVTSLQVGDHISASVGVNGSSTSFSLKDETTGQSFTQTVQSPNPDTSSAEWVAEAPSQCDGSGSCTPLPLSDFGTVGFTNATATANGHTGTISDPNWTAQPIALGSNGTYDIGYGSSQNTAGASPSSLSSDGSSFSVTWLHWEQERSRPDCCWGLITGPSRGA